MYFHFDLIGWRFRFTVIRIRNQWSLQSFLRDITVVICTDIHSVILVINEITAILFVPRIVLARKMALVKRYPDLLMTWCAKSRKSCDNVDANESVISIVTKGPFRFYDLTLIPAWIRDYIHYKVWDEINHPLSNSNSAAFEAWHGFIISTHFTLLSVWLLIHAVVKIGQPQISKSLWPNALLDITTKDFYWHRLANHYGFYDVDT